MFSSALHTFQYYTFFAVTYGIIVLYIFLWLHIYPPHYNQEKILQLIENVEFWSRMYVSLFLMWRFNPWRRVQFTSFDAVIVFNAGIYLFVMLYLSTFNHL